MGRRPTNTEGLIGQRFGKLTVHDITRTHDKKVAALCYCDCDPEHKRPIIVRVFDLFRGFKRSCGCAKHDAKPYRGTVKPGDKSGRLTVIKIYDTKEKVFIDSSGHRNAVALCKCSCKDGTLIDVKAYDIQSHNVKSCGCIDRERRNPVIIGGKYGRLTVIKEVERDPKTNRQQYLCHCDCNKSPDLVVDGHKLISGCKKSCGCLTHKLADEYHGRAKVGETYHGLKLLKIYKEHTPGGPRRARVLLKSGEERDISSIANLLSGNNYASDHEQGRANTPEKKALIEKLHGMKQRCHNPNNVNYRYYGARGVYVCDEWRNDQWKFVDWALKHGYRLGLTIDRIDFRGPYSPSNCRFINCIEQNNNRRTTKYLTIDGTCLSYAQWERTILLKPGYISVCLGKGYHTEEEIVRLIKERLQAHRETKINDVVNITIDGVTNPAHIWAKSVNLSTAMLVHLYKVYGQDNVARVVRLLRTGKLTIDGITKSFEDWDRFMGVTLHRGQLCRRYIIKHLGNEVAIGDEIRYRRQSLTGVPCKKILLRDAT